MQKEIEVKTGNINLTSALRGLFSLAAMETNLADPEKRTPSVKILETSVEN